MLLSLIRQAVVRPDRRPLYRRIFTNNRLNKLHLYTIRTIVGGCLIGLTAVAVDTVYYIVVLRPLKKEQQQLLEKELIEADLAGFNKAVELWRSFFRIAGSHPLYMFVYGVGAGLGFELFKIKFSMRGFSYYQTFREKQLQRELNSLEEELMENERNALEFLQRMKASS